MDGAGYLVARRLDADGVNSHLVDRFGEESPMTTEQTTPSTESLATEAKKGSWKGAVDCRHSGPCSC